MFQSGYYFIAFARAVYLLAVLPQIADENYGPEVHLILMSFGLMMTLEGEDGEEGREEQHPHRNSSLALKRTPESSGVEGIAQSWLIREQGKKASRSVVVIGTI